MTILLRGDGFASRPYVSTADLQKLYAQGLSLRTVGSLYGMSGQAVLKRLRNSNINRRPRGQPRKRRPPYINVKHMAVEV